MDSLEVNKAEVIENGFAILNGIFNDDEIANLIAIINNVETDRPTFRKTDDLFAIRQFFKELPAIVPYVFSQKLKEVITALFGGGCFVVKSIYFDKPSLSNWFVAYHQDLTVSTDKKHATDGFSNWTVKQNQYAVQPPVEILQGNFTIRIHLDDADENNGALKVITGSHKQGIIAMKDFDYTKEKETICCVNKGGIMIMKPLLLHASGRTVSDKQRRVIHVEFSKAALPEPLGWSEKEEIGWVE
jgi:ectoine hydroxylase-related dioxygenase (phytanoyl-CoA dioxygenase family)